MYTIQIKNIKEGRSGVFYVGRPTVLGNPFPLERERDRDVILSSYEKWFKDTLAAADPQFTTAIDELLAAIRRDGIITLGCWCSPRTCHAEVIAEHLAEVLFRDGEEVVILYV